MILNPAYMTYIVLTEIWLTHIMLLSHVQHSDLFEYTEK